MMSKKRKQYSSQFKAKVALEAVQNESTVAEIAQKYGVHPTMVNNWKRALLDGASNIFDKGQKSQQQNDAKVDELYRQIGQLKVERDFLSKKFGL
ncbi:transposase-like protein [Desulfosalsimonas propionicica]|uniref:Transposase-like protein n=1 Tax=Desulfosalsimonas propionicica TaxID=332175 RepID=A0A7W0CCL4_9BACT|nr:transposase-like protein [Desulfosalsimonas propionicica]